MILDIIIGILIWQLICTMTLIISNENDEIQTYVSCGIFLFIINFLMKFIARPLYLHIQRKYNLYQFFADTNDCGKSYYMTPKYASHFNFDNTKDCYIELKKEGKDFKSAPYKRSIVKFGQKPSNMTWEYFNKWKSITNT